MSEQPDFAEAVRAMAEETIAIRGQTLSAIGLRATVELKPWPSHDLASCELRVAFWRGNAFIDVIEDFVVQNEKPVASIAELRQWLELGIDAIVEENGGE